MLVLQDPKMKVERVSYDVNTPSAARAFMKQSFGNQLFAGISRRLRSSIPSEQPQSEGMKLAKLFLHLHVYRWMVPITMPMGFLCRR
jgi:hypothetical protein